MSRVISANGCVQISVDAFIDEMNGEKILAENGNLCHNALVEAKPSVVDFKILCSLIT